LTGIKPQLAILAALLLALGSTAAMAQRGFGRGGPQVDPKDQEAVWSLQSKSVAHDLGLTGEAADKLAATYKAARERAMKAFEAVPSGEGGDFRSRMEAFRKVRDSEREALAKDLAGILDAEKAKKAGEEMGLFSGFWDVMTKSLADIVANEDTRIKAVLAVNASLVKMDKEFSANREGGGGSEGRRERFQKSRDELNTELGKILSEDEMKKWKESNENMGQRRRDR
jgi:hypothetical protein